MKTKLTSKHWVGIAVLACAACCAVPVGAVMGIGAVATATGALFSGLLTESVICVALLGSAFLVSLYLWIRRRRGTQQRCDISCNIDASCCPPKSNS